jgi:hypothetical protein
MSTQQHLEAKPQYRFINSNQSQGSWHIGRRLDSRGDKSGKLFGVYYVTLCSGRQLGGAWGQSEKDEHSGNVCSRCATIARSKTIPSTWIALHTLQSATNCQS